MNRESSKSKAKGYMIIMVICSIAYCLFFIIFRKHGLNADFKKHIEFAIDIKNGTRGTVYPFLYSVVSYFARKFGYNDSMAIVTAAANTISIFIIFLIFVKMKFGYKFAALISPLFMIVSSIFNYQTKKIYMGTWTPNPYHNPTYIFLKPFVLVFVLLFVIIFSNKPEIVSGFKNVKDLICWCFAAVFLYLTGLAKPSYIQVFLPAFLVFMFIYMFRYKLPLKNKLFFMVKCAIVALPSVILFIIQYYNMLVKHIGYVQDSGTVIGLEAYGLWKLALHNRDVPFAVFCMCAFPLAITLFNFKKAIKDDLLILFWGIYAVSILQCLFISELGINKSAYNIVWGYQIAGFLLILYSAVFAVKCFEKPASEKPVSQVVWWIRVVIPIGLFGLHFATGLYYLINALVGHTYDI